ncbi:MAG: hypothetical protein AMXMBFR33_02550 [Candidatus Xenobia bacterium]
MKPFPVPYDLEEGSRVLVAGCGGGYDVVCALPIALELRRLGHTVHLASYGFTELTRVGGVEQPRPGLYSIHSGCEPPPNGYFPEGFLSKWWDRTFQEEKPVWAYRRVGVLELKEHFEYLTEQLGLNAIVIVDGGVDSLFFGDEHDEGTPTLDAISLIAAYAQRDLRRYFALTAFGTEGTGHSVRHYDALEHMAALERQRGALLGVSALVRGSEPGERFLSALEYIHERMDRVWHSNMASSIAAAMRGVFGHAPITVKAETTPIWVSPLQQLYWFYELDPVAEAKPYLQQALKTEGVGQMQALIQDYRDRQGIKASRDIPI